MTELSHLHRESALPSHVVEGRCARWELGYPVLEDVVHTFAGLEVTAIAPMTNPVGPSAAIASHACARQLVGAALGVPHIDAFEVRYRTRSRPDGGTSIAMYLLTKAYGVGVGPSSAARAAAVSAGMTLPSNFTVAPLVDIETVLPVPDWAALRELQRPEHVTFPQWNFVPADYYYYQDPISGDGTGWPAFWRLLARAPSDVIVSLLFKPSGLHPAERDALGSVITDLAVLGTDRTDYNILNTPDYYPGDDNARLAHEAWLDRLSHIERFPTLTRIAVAGMPEVIDGVAANLASSLAQAETVNPAGPMWVLSHAHLSDGEQEWIRRSIETMEMWPTDSIGMWRERGAPTTLRRTQYLFGLDEVSAVAILPVADESGAPGFPLGRRLDAHRRAISTDEAQGRSVVLGRFLHEGRVAEAAHLPLTAINRHVLVVGSPGSGKTTTVQTILAQLWDESRIPFLVVEPTKKEYRALLTAPGMTDLRVITIGNESVSPLRINPLAPPPGVRCEVHISQVMALLRLAMPLFPPLPELLAQALPRTFYRAGWDDESTIEDGLPPPTLRDLLIEFRAVFASFEYEGEARNIGRAFEARLGSLLTGSRGKVLDTIESSDLADLLGHPVVVELEDVVDPEDKAVIAAFVLAAVRSSAVQRRGSGGALRHVTVVEEAHRLLSRAAEGRQGAGGVADPRAEAVGAFVEAIAELRSSGEGFILCSQRPLGLAEAAVSNTGTRIIHRLESGQERDAVLDDLAATLSMRGIAARLRLGEAVIRWADMDEPELIRTNQAEGVDTARSIADDHVADHMAAFRTRTQAIMPHRMCSAVVCAGGCEAPVRRAGNRVAIENEALARQQQAQAASTGGEAARRVLVVLSEACAKDSQRTYCAAVHLSQLDAAFRVRTGVDDRPNLIAAVTEVCR